MIVHTCFNNSSEHGYKSSVLKSGICKYMRRDEKEKMKIDMQTTKHKINISQELLELLDQGKIYYKLN